MQTTLVDSANLFRLVHFFDILAAVVFAVSGALVASRKGMDVMGFMWLAVITGVGGGTVRDLILNVPVFWVQNPVHVSACLVTAVVMHFVAPLVESRYRTLLWFDAFGLALVTVAGTVKASGCGSARTGCHRDGRGHRDRRRNHSRYARPRTSVLLGHEIYVTASVLGACTYVGLNGLGVGRLAAMIAGFLVTFTVRGLAIKFGWSLPVFRESTKRERWKSDRKDSARDVATMTREPAPYRGDDKLLFGIILGVLAFWLFAQTTLNIAPAMAADLEVATNVMNIAVSITALFSGIFIVVVGGLADRVGRVKILMWGFILGIVGSLLVGIAPPGALAVPLLMLGRICQGLSARVHHAREPGAHQDVLGRRRPSTRGESLVHGLLGRIWIRRSLRRPHDRERRMALDLLRIGRRISGRDADGARNTGEQGCRRKGLSLRHDGCPDVHGDDGGIAGAGHSGK